HNSEETAGVPFAIKISAVNKDGVVVPAFSGVRPVKLSLRKAQSNPDAPAVVLTDADFGAFPPNVSAAPIEFVAGVATIPAAFTINSILDDIYIHAEENETKQIS